MRSQRLTLLLLPLVMAACAPVGSSHQSLSMEGTTGFSDTEGNDYVANGDERIEEALRKTPPPAPSSPVAKPLRERLKEFEISRFESNEKNPSRFGSDKMTLKVFFSGGAEPVEFKAPLQGPAPHLKIETESGGYRLSGELNDSDQETKGEFTLTEKKNGDQAQIFYWAYKTRLKVREDRTRPQTATLEKQLKDLSENTYGWANNWTVVRGVSFYLMDIVKIESSGSPHPPALLSFKGPSLRTGEAVHPVTEVSGSPSKIELVGNAESEPSRMFQVTMKDPQTQENHEFMLDVEKESPPAKTPQEPLVQVEEPEPIKPSPPQPSQQQTPAQPQIQTTEGKSYLRIDDSLPRTRKMTSDLNRNRNLPGVKQWIETYKGNYRTSLQKFYTYANPFRGIMEKVGQALDVSPAYAYLTVIESYYFTKGRYEIEGNSQSSALGPFQLIIGMAREMGLNAGSGGKDDERRYFVPSACGAARYMRKLVNKFGESDSTVAILGYFQGDGGAAAAIYCTFDPNAGNRQDCASRINSSFTSKDYGRFLRLVKNYNYNFADMDRMAAIPKNMRNYVNQHLAIYFISNDFNRHGFSLDKAPTRLPDNGTVMPNKPLKDRECQNAVIGVF